ncbi:MAG TPA: hypothetical protein VMU67_12845 [Steroidobacteraceae bacterium]|nr:hypothetical protein [Steroidobacteraceae bacterium]
MSISDSMENPRAPCRCELSAELRSVEDVSLDLPCAHPERYGMQARTQMAAIATLIETGVNFLSSETFSMRESSGFQE